MKTITEDLRDYLALRRGLGYKLHDAGSLLADFAKFLRRERASFITTDLALRWAKLAPSGQGPQWGRRLGVVRVFARHRSASDPRTEVPPDRVFPSAPPRKPPYIFSPEETRQLLRAAGNLYRGSMLRSHTYQTLFGLLAVTGMRSGEARRLHRDDVDLAGAVLTVRESKFGKSRLVPFRPSTVKALRRYAERRDRLNASPGGPQFFLSESGRPVGKQVLLKAFREARMILRPERVRDRRPPRMHDLRHTFAVRTVLRWYRAGLDVESRLPVLSTYLGHVHAWQTYWYLSAVPELMQIAGRRLERFLGDRS